MDNSIIHQRLQEWASSSAVIRLHSPQIAFYVQSAVESAQLLLLASLDAGTGQLPIHAITDLGWPVSLLDLTLGVLAARDAAAPRMALARSVRMAERHTANLTAEHQRILQTIQK